jgi:hypothetical protein
MIAIALMFHPGDAAQAHRLKKLIADNEELPREDVEFYTFARADALHDEGEPSRQITIKFPRSTNDWTDSKESGWPLGPNMMAHDVLKYFDHNADITRLDGVLLMEPDCIPVNKHWLNVLISEWNEARSTGKVMMGAWRNSGPPCGHINGNCMVIPALASFLKSKGYDIANFKTPIAWDCLIAPYLREDWATTGRILNRFQSFNCQPDDIATPDLGDDPPVLVHGYKDDSCFNLAQKILKLP